VGFKIEKRDSYTWSVEHVISMHNGKPEVMRFQVRFKGLTQSEVDKLLQASTAGKLTDSEFLGAFFLGWLPGELVKGNAEEFTYSAENLDELGTLYSGIRNSIVRAWVESVSGGGARRG